jgi:hypothetical protein
MILSIRQLFVPCIDIYQVNYTLFKIFNGTVVIDSCIELVIHINPYHSGTSPRRGDLVEY